MKGLLIQTLIILGSFSIVHAQSLELSSTSNFEIVNRHISVQLSDGKNIVHLDAAEGAGIAWLKQTQFATGTLEFDAKGKDVLQQSFLGIAFHGENDSSYDCIYFRPFNFSASDMIRKKHSVQYISMPQYDWQYLREKFPGKYENALTRSIEANSWFHVKIIVDTKAIEVFVNDDSKPSLTVTPLNNYTAGKIGFWVGNNSDGNFTNLVISKNDYK